MTKEQANKEQEPRNIGPLEAYRICAEGERENNRLLTERTTIYLLASSILFLAFVTLSQPTWFRIVLALAGCFLTFLLRSFNRATHNALDFYAGVMSRIEKRQEFDYMRSEKILHINVWEFIYGKKQWDQDEREAIPCKVVCSDWRRRPFLFKQVSVRWLPLTFGLLWLCALAVAIIN